MVLPGQVVWVRCTGTKWITEGNSNQALKGTRQTVTTGPLSSGAPNFLATVAGLPLSTSNVAAATPLIARASNGDFERWGLSTGNVSFGTLTNTATNYLLVTIGVDGVLTGSNTTQVPVYQESGTPGVTSGLFTFNYGEMKGYLGNGATAPQAYVVVVGEAVTSGGNVTAVTAYAYNGRFESAFTATIPVAGASASANHNIGVKPLIASFVIENTTTDGGYSVGDQIVNPGVDNTSFTYASVPRCTAKTIARTSGSGSVSNVVNATTGASAALAGANWKYKFSADRGWG